MKRAIPVRAHTAASAPLGIGFATGLLPSFALARWAFYKAEPLDFTQQVALKGCYAYKNFISATLKTCIAKKKNPKQKENHKK